MSRDPGSALDPLLCFAVYSLERRITRIYRELLEPFGLSYTQFLVLTLLHSSDEPMRVGSLGEALDLDSGTLSPLLRRLESAGLVTRARGVAGDDRVVSIGLTDEGAALQDALGDVRRCLGERMPLDADEAGALMASLRLANTRLANTRLANTGLANTGLANTGLANTRLANTGFANTRLAAAR